MYFSKRDFGMPRSTRKIYGPRLSFALPLKREQMGAMEWRASRLILRSVPRWSTSYGTVAMIRIALWHGSRDLRCVAAQDNTSYLNASNDHEHEYLNRPASHRGLLDTPRFREHFVTKILMVLVEDAVAQVQSQCPFRVRLRLFLTRLATRLETRALL